MIYMKNVFLTAAMVAVTMLVASPSTVSANLLVNGDFEDVAAPPGGHAAVGWPKFSFTSNSVLDATMPQSGNNAIIESGGTSTTGSTGIFQEVLGVSPGETYTLTGWAKAGGLPITTDDTNGSAVMRIVWELTGGADVAEEELILGPEGGAGGAPVTGNGLLSTDWQKFSITGTAPATTQQIKVQLYARHGDQAIYFDNYSLVKIPEPTSIALSMLALMGLAARRRS